MLPGLGVKVSFVYNSPCPRDLVVEVKCPAKSEEGKLKQKCNETWIFYLPAQTSDPTAHSIL